MLFLQSIFVLFAITLQCATVFAKVGPAQPPKPPKPTKASCGTSGCDVDMFNNNVPNFAFHVPNLGQLQLTNWVSPNNVINSGKLDTLYTTTNTFNTIKYGGFCGGSQKISSFQGAFVPVGVPDPSWIVNIPTGDLDAAGNLNPGTYKLDLTNGDLLAMNQAATACQNICSKTKNCKYTHYGWEAPAGWFCKLWTNAVCLDSLNNWWKPAPPALGAAMGAAPPINSGFGGGCRVTDTISTLTPLLNPGVSLAISPTTPFTASLPYLNPLSYTAANGIVASIKCDVVAGGLTPGWPTFGTTWV